MSNSVESMRANNTQLSNRKVLEQYHPPNSVALLHVNGA
jgi:hypothetical protein